MTNSWENLRAGWLCQQPRVIELTNSDKVAVVDDLFYLDILALGPWRWTSKGYVEMAMHTRWGYFGLHTIVMDFCGHDRTGLEVDHRDRNKLDNRLCNLRLASGRQNSLNRGRKRTNKSGYIGVCEVKRTGKWQAHIHVDGKQKHVGHFADKIEAARARDAAILAGPDADFAVLNFPGDGRTQINPDLGSTSCSPAASGAA